MSNQTKFLLQESEMPTAWYNIQNDFETPLPPVINPGTGQPIGPQDLAPLFPMELIMQEVGVGPYATSYVDIPEEVQEIYKLWRPTPLIRARRLEKALGTPAHIYFKYEASRRPARTNPTPPSRRRITTNARAPNASPPKRVLDNGAARFRSPVRCLISSAKSIWSRFPIAKNPTAAF